MQGSTERNETRKKVEKPIATMALRWLSRLPGHRHYDNKKRIKSVRITLSNDLLSCATKNTFLRRPNKGPFGLKRVTSMKATGRCQVCCDERETRREVNRANSIIHRMHTICSKLIKRNETIHWERNWDRSRVKSCGTQFRAPVQINKYSLSASGHHNTAEHTEHMTRNDLWMALEIDIWGLRSEDQKKNPEKPRWRTSDPARRMCVPASFILLTNEFLSNQQKRQTSHSQFTCMCSKRNKLRCHTIWMIIIIGRVIRWRKMMHEMLKIKCQTQWVCHKHKKRITAFSVHAHTHIVAHHIHSGKKLIWQKNE